VAFVAKYMKKKAHEEFMMFESLIIIQNIQAFSNYVTIFLYFRCILMAGGLEIPFLKQLNRGEE